MGFEGAVRTNIWHLGSAGSKYLLGILIYNGSVLPMFQGCGGVPGQGRGDSLWGEFYPSRLLYSTDSYFLPLVFVFHDKNQSYKYEKIQQGNGLVPSRSSKMSNILNRANTEPNFYPIQYFLEFFTLCNSVLLPILQYISLFVEITQNASVFFIPL